MKNWKRSIAYLLSGIMLMTSINMVSFAAENDSEEYYPKVTLGSNVKEEGLRIITAFTPAVRGNREGLMSGEKAGGGNPEYINVDVDDNYLYDAPIFTGVEVSVEYFDDEKGRFNLSYDTHNPEANKYIANNDRYGGSTLIVNLTGTKQWLTHTFYLEDARFANRLSNGTDFRVGIWSPSMGSTNGAIVFGSISVKKVPVREIFKYNGMTSDKLGNIFSNTDEIKLYNNLKVKNNDSVTSQVKSEVYDANHKLLYEHEQEVKFGPGEEKKVEITPDNPKTFGIYTVKTTVQSKTDNTGLEFTNTYTDEFSVCDVVKKEDGNPMIGYCSQIFSYIGKPDETPDLTVQAGGTWLRMDVLAWNQVESSKGIYNTALVEKAKDWAITMKEHGVNISGIFKGRVSFYDNGNNPSSPEGIEAFAKYCAYLADEFEGVIDQWEVWNEWNIKGFNPTLEPPEVYAKVLKAVYTEVKKVNPNAVIVGLDTAGLPHEKKSASVYDWVKRVLAAGAYDYMDAVSGHHYDWGKEGVDEVKLIESVQTLQDLMSEYGPPKPVFISEIGSSTTTDGTPLLDQPGALAIYYGVLRAYGLADLMTYYCMYDRADDSDVEASWGSVYCWQYDYNSNPEAKRTASGAKPAYIAMAAMNNFVGGTADFEKVLEKDRTYAMKYYNKTMHKHVVTAVAGYTGEQEGKSVTYDFGTNHIELYDMYGNKVSDLSSDNGKYTFYVNRQPIYLVGDINTFELAEEGSAILTSDKGEKSSIVGDIVEFTYTKNTDEDLTLSCDLPDSAELVEEPVFHGNTAKVRIRVLKNDGDIRFKVNALSPSGALLYSQNHKIVLGAPVSVEITSGQFIENSTHWRAEVKIKSLCDSVVMTGNVNIVAPEEMLPAAYARNFVLAPRQEVVFYYPIPEKTIQNVLDVTAVAQCDNGETITKEAKLDFTSAAYTKKPPKIDGVMEQGEWNSIWVGADTKKDVLQITDWRGPSDLSFGGTAMWDEDYFYLAAVVTDDYHCVTYTPEGAKNMWRGDGIQFGLDDHPEINSADKVRFTEIGLAEVPEEGDIVYRFSSAYDLPVTYVEKAKLAVKRMDGYTVYELALPWDEIFYEGYVPDPSKIYRFSLMANDNDGGGRRGWIEYCSGIGEHKDVTLFGTMNLSR